MTPNPKKTKKPSRKKEPKSNGLTIGHVDTIERLSLDTFQSAGELIAKGASPGVLSMLRTAAKRGFAIVEIQQRRDRIQKSRHPAMVPTKCYKATARGKKAAAAARKSLESREEKKKPSRNVDRGNAPYTGSGRPRWNLRF